MRDLIFNYTVLGALVCVTVIVLLANAYQDNCQVAYSSTDCDPVRIPFSTTEHL